MLHKDRLLVFDGDVHYKTHCEENLLQLGRAERYYFVFLRLTFIRHIDNSKVVVWLVRQINV